MNLLSGLKLTSVLRTTTLKSSLTKASFGAKTIRPADFDFFDQKFTHDLELRAHNEKVKCFRVMDENGTIINKGYDNIPKEKLLKIFDTMVTIHEAD